MERIALAMTDNPVHKTAFIDSLVRICREPMP